MIVLFVILIIPLFLFQQNIFEIYKIVTCGAVLEQDI